MAEMVPIVDKDNNIIDVVERSVMRQKELPHRASYIVLCNNDNRFLIEIRTLKKDFAKGMLDACIGGVIDDKEDERESAKRELLEEVSVKVPDDNFHFLGTEKIESGKTFIYGYYYFVKGDFITKRQKEEVSGIMYLKYDEMERIKDSFVPDSYYAFKRILEKAQKLNLV